MNPESMPVPVYLIHWNAPEWVQAATTSIAASDVPVALTVVSNSGPVDVSGATVIDTGANLGFTGGANRALRHWLDSPDPAPYAIIGTHDLHLASDAVRLMLSAMEADAQLGICAPMMPDAPVVPPRGEGGTEWLMGQCMMLRRECAAALGGFDERFGTYDEDRDYCLRAWNAGWSVKIVDGATGHGLGSISTRARPLRLGNAVGFARKHHGTRQALKLLMAQPILSLVNVKNALVSPRDARKHLRYGLDRLRSIPVGIRAFRRFRPARP